MPIESAQYIDTLQPDWPLGSDPESAGDDHLRMIKQVLQNTFPSIKGAVQAGEGELNNLNTGWTYQPASGQPEGMTNLWKARDIEKNDGTLMGAMFAAASVAQFNTNPDLALTFRAVMNILYPVGSIWIDANGNDPTKYLGFGTWEAVTGMIAGAGTVPDGHGLSHAIGAGDKHGEGSWRVQDAHFVAENKTVNSTGTAESNGGHAHGNGIRNPGNYADALIYGTRAGSSGGGAWAEGGTNQTTQGNTSTDGAHGHDVTASGSLTIGTGTATSGTVFVSPYYGLYFWKRTA